MPIDQIIQVGANALLTAFAKGNAEAARILSERLLPKPVRRRFIGCAIGQIHKILHKTLFQIVVYGTRLERGRRQSINLVLSGVVKSLLRSITAQTIHVLCE